MIGARACRCWPRAAPIPAPPPTMTSAGCFTAASRPAVRGRDVAPDELRRDRHRRANASCSATRPARRAGTSPREWRSRAKPFPPPRRENCSKKPASRLPPEELADLGVHPYLRGKDLALFVWKPPQLPDPQTPDLHLALSRSPTGRCCRNSTASGCSRGTRRCRGSARTSRGCWHPIRQVVIR